MMQENNILRRFEFICASISHNRQWWANPNHDLI